MHWERLAASRAAWTAGSSKAIRTAIIAITTRSSINVNAREDRRITDPPPLVSLGMNRTKISHDCANLCSRASAVKMRTKE